MARSQRTGRLLAAALLLSMAAGERARAQEPPPFLEVSKTDAGFTVEAEGATLPQVLAALGEKAGFSVQDAAAERPPIPLLEVRDAPLETALRRLLGTSNHLIVYRPGQSGRIEDGAIEKIVLLSPGKRERAPARPVSSLAGPGAPAAPAARRPNTVTGEPPAENVWEPDPAGDPEPEMEPAGGVLEPAVDETGSEYEYRTVLEEMERQAIEQVEVDPGAVAVDEPGMEPSMAPSIVEDPSVVAYDEVPEELPPPEIAAPID